MEIKQYNEELLKKDPFMNFGQKYRQCTVSVMDTIADPHISFDHNGVCNYFHEYQNKYKQEVFPNESGERVLSEIAEKIKKM